MGCGFLTGPQLSNAILEILKGDNLKCAVAFWGGTLVDSLLRHPINAARLQGAKIVCNLAMGGTNPCAIEALGAPDKSEVRHNDNLHAKVYISDFGMIVSSANASANGIGIAQTQDSYIEAGAFFSVQSVAWANASSWFDQLFERATIVKKQDLIRAKLNLSSQWDLYERPLLTGSLFDFVARNANAFGPIGFVITESETTEEDRNIARKAAIKENPPEKETEIHNIDDHWIYVGWTRKDVSSWPRIFVSMHLSENKELVEVCGGEFKFCSWEEGSIFGSDVHWNRIRSLMPNGVPPLPMIKQIDGDMAWRLLRAEGEDAGGVMFSSAQELARAMAVLDK